MNSFTINRKLCSLNDVIAANRANKYKGATLKRDIEEAIGWDIKQALTSGRLRPVTEPCEIFIKWHMANKRMDCDNIQSSAKFILDAMQKNGIIVKDSRRYVKQIYHQIIDDKKDYSEVFIYPENSIVLQVLIEI